MRKICIELPAIERVEGDTFGNGQVNVAVARSRMREAQIIAGETRAFLALPSLHNGIEGVEHQPGSSRGILRVQDDAFGDVMKILQDGFANAGIEATISVVEEDAA